MGPAAEFATDAVEGGLEEDEGGCGAHRLLYGAMDHDLAPWHSLGLRVSARQMGELVEFVRAHRGRWDSWGEPRAPPGPRAAMAERAS